MIRVAAEAAPFHHRQDKIEAQLFSQDRRAFVQVEGAVDGRRILGAIQPPLAIGRKMPNSTLPLDNAIGCSSVPTRTAAAISRPGLGPLLQNRNSSSCAQNLTKRIFNAPSVRAMAHGLQLYRMLADARGIRI
jgi:hypothetical protein